MHLSPPSGVLKDAERQDAIASAIQLGSRPLSTEGLQKLITGLLSTTVAFNGGGES